jgi:hypothetical protein
MAESSWIMRSRITLAAVVLGLAVAGVTLARQQPGDSLRGRGQGNGPVPAALENASQLRVQVAELRAEVELGEIQHDVDKAMLTEMMKEVEQAQWKEASKPIQQADSNGGRTVENQDSAVRGHQQKDRIGIVEAEVRHMKERFRERAIKLHGMKFALADHEERLANGWSR